MAASVAACSLGPPAAPDDADPGTAAAEPSPGTSDGIAVDPDAAPEPEADDGEEPAAPRADGRPALPPLAELDAGGDPSSVVAVDEAWCAVVQPAATPDPGVWVEVYEVESDPGRAVEVTCGGAASCVGATLTHATPACAIAVVPPTPGTESVSTALNVRISCDSEELCEDYRARVTTGTRWVMPSPAPPAEEDGA